jgi:hypothetical protein
VQDMLSCKEQVAVNFQKEQLHNNFWFFGHMYYIIAFLGWQLISKVFLMNVLHNSLFGVMLV